MTFLRSIRFRPDQIQIIRFVVSFLLATLLWGWVTQLQDPFTEREYPSIPIETTDLDDTRQLVSTLPETTVTLGDAASVVNEIDRSDISVRIDTDSIDGPGTYQVPLIVDSPQVNERSIEPSEVSVQVDARVTRLFPLTNQNTSEGDQARTIGEVAPEPSQVTVSGPWSAVDRIDSVVLPVSLGEHVDDFDDTFTPYAADANGQAITEVEILPGQVQTRVEVQTRGRTVSIIPHTTGTPADGFSIEERRAIPDVIVVDGPPELLDALLFVNTEPVEVTGATESFSGRVALADLPEGVTVLDPSDGTVEVRVAINNMTQTSQSLSALNVEQVGLGDGLEAELNPAQVSLQVTAPVETLQAMRAEDIEVFVDLTGLAPGTHILQPQVTMPQGATWLGNEPAALTVTVRQVEAAGQSPATATSDATPDATFDATPD